MYFAKRPRAAFDPARLLAPDLPRGNRFETLADCRRTWAQNRKVLLSSGSARLGYLVPAIDGCMAGEVPCGMLLCSRCTRRGRRWSGGKILRLNDRLNLSALLLTIYGERVSQGGLSRANLRSFHARLRKRLQRSEFDGVLIGGTEVAWKAKERRWLVHAHLIAFGASQEAVERLRARCSVDSLPGSPAFRCDPVRDLVRVATYVQKFSWWHHPGTRSGGGRPRALPLPPALACEFAEFLSRHRMQDFLFLYGCRRRGSRIEVL